MVNFFKNLERSILDEGFRNPIIVSAFSFSNFAGRFQVYKMGDKFQRFKKNFLPSIFKEKDVPILVCYKQGGSRLWVAQKHNLEIPCLICDYCDYFPEIPSCENTEEIKNYFKDQVTLRFSRSGIIADGLSGP